MKKILLLVSLIALSFLVTGITHAGEVTGNLEVSVNVVGVCTVTTSPVNFGDSAGADYTMANGDVTVNCPVNQAYNIALDAGQHFDGEYRRVMSGSYAVRYWLQQDSIAMYWGDHDYANTYQFGNSLADTGTGSDQPHTVYGYLDPFAGIPGGTIMTDTVTVTVYY